MDERQFVQHVVETLSQLGIPYCIVGSYASMRYGEPRFTRDIDFVVELKEDQVAELCAAFPDPEYYVSELAARDAVRFHRQFNVIHNATAFKADLMLPGFSAWSKSQIERGRTVELFPNVVGRLASPEDVILGKLRYHREGGSDKHIRDITSMLETSGDEIDREDITRWAEQLGVLEIWLAILADLDQPRAADEAPPF